MRRHNDYYYKSYDRNYLNEQDRICNECFNEYGYNFDTNKRKTINEEVNLKKTNYQQSLKKIEPKK